MENGKSFRSAVTIAGKEHPVTMQFQSPGPDGRNIVLMRFDSGDNPFAQFTRKPKEVANLFFIDAPPTAPYVRDDYGRVLEVMNYCDTGDVVVHDPHSPHQCKIEGVDKYSPATEAEYKEYEAKMALSGGLSEKYKNYYGWYGDIETEANGWICK